MVGLGFSWISEVSMVVSKSWLRVCAAVALTVGLLGLGMGCGGSGKKNSANSRIVSGTVTYIRRPLHVGSDGRPTGLEDTDSSNVKLPARGVQVRIFQARDETEVKPDGTTATVQAWVLVGTGTTDATGYYAVGGLSDGYLTFAELYSASTGTGGPVRLVGDPDGIGSAVPQPSRVLYCMRKAIDGSTSTTNATAASVLGGDTTVNFDVGLTDPWLLAPAIWNQPKTGPFPYPRTVNAGSRILAILDSIYTFRASYGDPTPGSLDLHYYPGQTEPKGSFIEYKQTVYPHSFDGTSLTYFGSLAGGPISDDAFMEGVIFPLLGRNNLFGQGMTNLLPPTQRLGSLAPPLAVVEGFADAMAACLLKSPYLPDTTLPARYPARDIRTVDLLADGQAAFSVPQITALAWQMGLKTNSISDVPTDWAKITPSKLLRLFTLTAPVTTLNTVSVATDVSSLYGQVARMQEGAVGTDTVNYLSVFPDTVLKPLLAGFNLPWPGITALPKYTDNWGADPDTAVTAVPGFTLSMAQAEMVGSTYPNISKGEVAYAMFSLAKDRAFDLSLTTSPALSALPAGVYVEVTVNGGVNGIYKYGTSYPATNNIKLLGNFLDNTQPNWHRVQFRLVSPAAKQPDLKVTVNLVKTN